MPRPCIFVPKPSPELSYILGVLDGDGYVRIKGKHYLIGLQSIDYEFVEEFNNALIKVFGKNRPYSIFKEKRDPPRKPIYRVEGICKKFVKWYLRTPREDRWSLAKKYPKKYLRGIYDSEGSVTVQECHSSNAPILNCRIDLSNTDLVLLSFVQKLLVEQGYRPKMYKVYDGIGFTKFPEGLFLRRKAEYVLRILRRGDVMRFVDDIGFTVKRRQERLRRYVMLYKKYGAGIKAIIEWRKMRDESNQ